jgi:dephospho-CoA kinase
MEVVGLTGGVASGKSFVAHCLEELGASRIDADLVAHEVLKDVKVIGNVVDRWGDDVLDDDGQIDRKRLGKIVFGGPDDTELDQLESIMHPEIRIRIRKQIDQFKGSANVDLLVLDIPLLFESEYNQHCDHVIFVDAARTLRQQRAKLRGWAEDELDRRELRQLPIEEKKLRSDVVIDNSGTKESTARQLADFVEGLGISIPNSFRDLYLDSSKNKESEINPDPPNGHR